MEKPVIYIDTLFFINFIVDYLLLLASAKITAAAFKRIRLVLGAALGALYAVAVVVPATAFLGHFALKIAVACLMALVSFGYRPGCGFLKISLVFVGLSFALAGGLMALDSLTGYGYGPEGLSGILYLNVSLKTLMLAAAGFYAVFSLVFRAAAAISGKRGIVRVRAVFLSREADFQAMVDTGNTLRDPLDQSPVMVVEFNTAKCLLPDDLKRHFSPALVKNPVAAMEVADALGYGRYFRLVPFKTVGVECGMLLAFRTDSAKVDGAVKKGLLLAISPERLSDGEGYTALSGIL